jgi:hypothetical protein
MFEWSRVKVGLMLLVISGCGRFCGNNRSDLAPEQVVEAYLDTALNMTKVSQRRNLMQFTTGNLKAAIASVSEETIKKVYIDRKFEIVSYSIMERRDRTPRETEITFQLTYRDLGTGETAKPKGSEGPKVTTENTVSVIKEHESWFIRDVIGQKTSIDFPVSDASRIEAKPGQMTPEEPEEEGVVQ